jgi:hypothetical protein
MSAKIDDGGPAFPTEPNTQPGFYVHHGMSLRDWFAGQALHEIAANHIFRGNASHMQECAKLAYEFADAMLAARSPALVEGEGK